MTTNDLGAHIAALDEAWPTLTSSQRDDMRANYKADGWSTCDHPECPPWSCRGRHARRYIDALVDDALGTPATGIVKGGVTASPFTVVAALVVDVDSNTIQPISNRNTSTKESN